MLEKKIASKLHNQELDPQDSFLFEKIMTERSKRNGKAGFLLLSSIALMFVMITGFSVSKYWGNIPTDGYSQAEIAAIRVRESGQFKEANVDANNLTENRVAVSATTPATTLSTDNNLEMDNAKIVRTKSGVVENNTMSDAKSSKSVTSEKSIKNNKDEVASKVKDETNISAPLIITTDLEKEIKPKSTVVFNFNQRTLKPLNTEVYLVSDAQSTLNVSPKVDEDDKGTKTNKTIYKLWPRELNFYAGTYYNQRFINNNNSIMGQMIQDYDVITSTNLIGINGEYNLKKSIFAQIGFQWMSVNSTVQNYTIQQVNHRQETVVDPGGNSYTRDIYDTSNISVSGGKNSNQYFEIPLTVGARWQIKRHIIQPQFGIVSSFYTSGKGYSFTNTGELQAVNNKQDRFTNINLQMITGFSYTYMFGQQLGLYINPNLRYGITNQTKKSFGFGEYNSMIGGQVGVKYILK